MLDWYGAASGFNPDPIGLAKLGGLLALVSQVGVCPC